MQRERDAAKIHSDLSEDLFKVHDFDVKIDLQVPNAGEEKRRRLILIALVFLQTS